MPTQIKGGVLVELGIHHIFYDAPPPYDEETLQRFVGDVKPMLEAHSRNAVEQPSSA